MGSVRILVIHGPNLNRLGTREPELYGHQTLEDVNTDLMNLAKKLSISLETFQSNHEGALLDRLHEAADAHFSGVLLNAGAYTHTSMALADAVSAVAPLPVIEVHITNTAARHRPSVIGPACLARVEGFGCDSYQVALWALERRLRR